MIRTHQSHFSLRSVVNFKKTLSDKESESGKFKFRNNPFKLVAVSKAVVASTAYNVTAGNKLAAAFATNSWGNSLPSIALLAWVFQ